VRTAVQVVLALSLLCNCRLAAPQPPAAPVAAPTPQLDVKAAFDQAYADWLAYLPSVSFHSDSGPYVNNEPFNRMVALGPAALPCFFAKLTPTAGTAEPAPSLLWAGVWRLTKRNFSKEELEAAPRQGQTGDIWFNWWRAGEAGARRDFDTRLAAWHQVKGNAKTVSLWTQETVYLTDYNYLSTPRRQMTPAGDAYQALQDLGLAILPFLAEQFQQGNYEFVDMAYALTDNKPPPPSEVALSAKGRA